MSVQDLVEQALDLASLPVVVTVTERTEANLRWANNALTTNGEMHSRTLSVTATAEVSGGTAAGTVSQEIARPTDVAAVSHGCPTALFENTTILNTAQESGR